MRHAMVCLKPNITITRGALHYSIPIILAIVQEKAHPTAVTILRKWKQANKKKMGSRSAGGGGIFQK